MIQSYPSIYNFGHRAIEGLLDSPVLVEEKVDGSQFSFGVGVDGFLYARSKGAHIILESPEKMFNAAVATVKDLAPVLTPGWTYRGEYLAKPHHNGLAYERVPHGHIILFDINPGMEAYLTPSEKLAEGQRLGLEVVPLLFAGQVSSLDQFRALLETVSVLGGQKIEGVVVKPAGYDIYGADKKVLMGKFVSEAFKETQSQAWKESNPKGADILERLGSTYGHPARWQKAVIHLRERGEIEDDPRDIGKLFKEVHADVEKECADEIRDALYKWGWPQIARKLGRGLPAWYKEELLKKQFGEV